jgi:hypothetical protein
MGRRVVASYCSSFLKPEMLHIYRQVKALRGVDTFVVTKGGPERGTISVCRCGSYTKKAHKPARATAG